MENKEKDNNVSNQSVSKEIDQPFHNVPTQKKIKGGLIASVVLLLLITSLYAYQNYQSQKQHTSVPKNIDQSPKDSSKSIVLKIPVIEYESPGNELTKAIVVGYEDKILTTGEEFIINPETLGYHFGQSLGDIKLRLIEVRENSIVIDIVADEIHDGSFYSRDPLEREEIVGTKCVSGRPLVTDVSSEYCLTLSTNEPTFSLFYTIEEESTILPSPSN
jgi:hypothetical protein